MAKQRGGGSNRPQPVGRMTRRDLKWLSDHLPRRFGGLSAPRAYVLAKYAMAKFFGKDWVVRHIDNLNSPSPFLRVVYEESVARISHEIRVTMLAEMLFNLQEIEGFHHPAEHIRDGQIESGYAELEMGRFLSVHHIPFRFVVPSAGATWDLEVIYPDGLAACADTKCKLEDTEPSTKTLENSLREARSKFPSDRPSIVFIKVPREWITQAFEEEVDAFLARFFRGTGRIVSVVIYASKIGFQDNLHTEVMSHLECISHHHRFDRLRDWKLFPNAPGKTLERRKAGEWNGFPPHWTRFFHAGERDPTPDEITAEELQRRRGLVMKDLHQRYPERKE